MSDRLAALLERRTVAAVYRWPAAPSRSDACAQADGSGWGTFLLDGAGVRDRETFLAACAEAFELPQWFGHNWDALWDCLTDLSWAPARAYLVIYERWGELAVAAPQTWATARTLLVDVSRYWNGQRAPFAVLLTGEGPETDVPELPSGGRL